MSTFKWDKRAIKFDKLFNRVMDDPCFRSYVEDAIVYALNTYESARGDGASDVLLLNNRICENKMYWTRTEVMQLIELNDEMKEFGM